MLRRTVALSAVVLAVALFSVGCGGGGSTTSNPTTTTTVANKGPLTKAEFIKQADEICRKKDLEQDQDARIYRNQHSKQLAQLKPIPREEKVIRVVEFPSIAKQTEEIKGLEVPPGDEKQINALIVSMEVGLTKAKKNPYSIELEVGKNPFEKADRLLRAYGFVDCRNVI